MRTKGRDFVVADFETSTEEWLEKDNGYARVWLWGIYNPNNNKFEYGITIKSFINRVLTINHNHDNPIIYFHNLKFDGSYILNYLLRSKKYHYDDKIETKNSFRAFISDMGLWYSIEVCLYVKGKRKTIVRFQDSLKKIPLPVRDIPKAFNFEDAKGDIDYNLYRPIGHTPTEEELYYIKRDCTIVAHALEQLTDEGFEKNTCASDSLEKWQETLIPKNNPKANPKKAFRDYFPELPLEIDDFVRESYKGGFTYVNPKFKNKIVHNLQVYDINSMYPSMMREKRLPYGSPTYFVGKPTPKRDEVYICHIRCGFDIKENHIPSIQLKNSLAFIPTEYISSSNDLVIDMYLTSVDLHLLFKQYDCYDLEYVDGYYFKAKKGFFDDYIDNLMLIKTTSKGGKRYLAKLRMNSVYGKTATNPRKKSKIPYLDEGVLSFKLSEERIGKPEYTAVGSFITAYARSFIISQAQQNYENFVYCDTDSLHLLYKGETPDLLIHESKLGYFKLENEVKTAKFLRAKTYIEDEEVKCAGAPDSVKAFMNIDNFKVGACFRGKLQLAQVKGGAILKDIEFKIH